MLINILFAVTAVFVALLIYTIAYAIKGRPYERILEDVIISRDASEREKEDA